MSLLEVILTLCIVSLVVAFAVPTEQSLWRQYQAKRAGTQWLVAIQTARESALMYQKSRALTDKDLILPSGATIHWRAFPIHHAELIFLPTGFTDTENGTFWFCWEKEMNPRWAIFINQAGRARLVNPDRNNHINDSRQLALSC